jgi:hypothetical protein
MRDRHIQTSCFNGMMAVPSVAIAHFMRELERAWNEHQEASLVRRDLNGSLAHLAAEPSVRHIPALTGAAA